MRPAAVLAAVLAGSGVLAATLEAGSLAPLTATGIRIAERPGAVRVVVDFTGGRVLEGEVVASDPNPFPDGVVRLPLSRAGVQTTAVPVTALGVAATIAQGDGRIVMRLEGADRRFKYVHYQALSAPQRLVIDLYKSRPPGAAAEIRRAPDGCLTLTRAQVDGRRIRAAGRERDLFEHALGVILRRADGRTHAMRAATAAGRRWSTSFPFRAAPRQAGTLEAVAFSAKDGTLDCLTQIRVRFGGA